MRWRQACSRLAAMVAAVVAGFLLSAMLARYAPGFGIDVRELDARLTAEALDSVRGEAGQYRDLGAFLSSTVSGWLRGDLGESRSLGQPVAQLLAERAPVTLKALGWGVLGGWTAGLCAALGAAARFRVALVLGELAAGLLLAAPPAVLAILFFLWQGPLALAIALCLFPKVFRFSRHLLEDLRGRPHVLLARAKGVEPHRIWMAHVLPLALPELAALGGVTVSLGFGASIPLEVVGGVPGMGQLAWQAAMARDLPLLVAVTMAVTAVTLLASAAADLLQSAGEAAR